MADSTPIFLSLYSDKEISEEQYQQELIKEFGGRIEDFDPKQPLGKRHLKKRIGYVFLRAFSKSRFRDNSDKAKKEFIKKVKELSVPNINANSYQFLVGTPGTSHYRPANTRQFSIIVNSCVLAINSVYEATKASISNDWFSLNQNTDEPLLKMTEYQKRCWVACALLNVITREELNNYEIQDISKKIRDKHLATIALITTYASFLGSNDLEFLLQCAMKAGKAGGLHISSTYLEEGGCYSLRTYAIEQGYMEDDEDVPEDNISEENFLKLLNIATEKRDLTLAQHLYSATPHAWDMIRF